MRVVLRNEHEQPATTALHHEHPSPARRQLPIATVGSEEHPSPPRRHQPSHSGGGDGGGRGRNTQALDADQESFLPASARAASSSVAASPVAPVVLPSPSAVHPMSVTHAPVPARAAADSASLDSHRMLQSFPAFFSLSLTAPEYEQQRGAHQQQQQRHQQGSHPADHLAQLASLPSDCLFLVLLHLDGASLASLSRCSTSLCSLVEGEDSADVWRGVARADVVRLFLHERAALAFAEPHTPGPGEGDDEATAAPMRRAQQQQAALDPRTQYLLRLKQRRMTLQGASMELQRLRLKVAQIRKADSLYVRRQLAIEAAFLLAFPLAMLAVSILLLCIVAQAIPRAHAGLIVMLPVWMLLLSVPLMGVCMHRLRAKFLDRKRRERADAAAAPPTVGATPSTSTRGRSQQPPAHSQQNQLQLPQGAPGAAAAAGAGAVPPSPSSSSAAANSSSNAAARARSRAATEAALQRERRNNRFLAGAARAAEARGGAGVGGASASSASVAASNALIAQAHDGLLARLIDSHFDTFSHCAVNGARISMIAASTVMLAVKLSAAHDGSSAAAAAAADLPFMAVFAPLYALGLYALCHPLLPAWCAGSDESSRAEFAGSTAAFARRHALHCVQWTLAPLLTMLLLGLYLDGAGSGSVSHLAYALAPLWAWQAAACMMLLGWAIRFGLGVTAGFEIAPAPGASVASIQMAAVAPPPSQPMQPQALMGAALAPPPELAMEDGSGARFAGPAARSAGASCGSRLFAVCCAPLLRLRFRARRHPDHRNARLALTLVAVLLVVACLVLFEALLCVRSISPPSLRMIPLVAAWFLGSALCVASVRRMRAQLAEAEYTRTQADTQARMARV